MLSFDLAVFDFNLISGQDDRDVLTNTSEITMPVRNIFVGDTGGNVEHDNGALTLDVVSITKSSEFLFQERRFNVSDREKIPIDTLHLIQNPD